jgi:hypothetical protein
MKLRLTLLIVFALAIAVVASTSRPALATPSYRLGSALSQLQQLSDAAFANVVQWARDEGPRPSNPSTPAKVAEQKISDLEWSDRSAVMNWLTGGGRSALYARGASDSDIGGRRPGVQATPNPYRLLGFASPSLNDTPQGHIQITGGFAAARNDGTSAVVCVSFRNLSPKTATRIEIDFPLQGAGGRTLATLHLDRSGEFSPNVDINGWSSLTDWQSGVGHKGFNDNCTSVNRNVAANPILHAASATYEVTRVEYRNGTVWP